MNYLSRASDTHLATVTRAVAHWRHVMEGPQNHEYMQAHSDLVNALDIMCQGIADQTRYAGAMSENDVAELRTECERAFGFDMSACFDCLCFG